MAEAPWGDIKPLYRVYIISERERERERVYKISEKPNFHLIFCNISILFLLFILQRYKDYMKQQNLTPILTQIYYFSSRSETDNKFSFLGHFTGKLKYLLGYGSFFRVKCHHSVLSGLKP